MNYVAYLILTIFAVALVYFAWDLLDRASDSTDRTEIWYCIGTVVVVVAVYTAAVVVTTYYAMSS